MVGKNSFTSGAICGSCKPALAAAEEILEPAVDAHVDADADASYGHGTGSSGDGCAGGVLDSDVELAVAAGVEVGLVLDHVGAALARFL